MTTLDDLNPATLFARDTWTNPFPVYTRLRARSPLRIPGRNEPAFAVLRYNEVYDVLRDHATFSSQMGGMVLIGEDPPRHQHMRALVNRAFTPRRIAELRPSIGAIVDELLDAAGEGEVEAVAALTAPLPVRVIARMLGIPESEHATFKRWSDSLISGITLDAAERGRNFQEMSAYFRDLATARRGAAQADLITALVQAEVNGERLQEWEVISFCILLLVAGNETTTNLLSNMLNILADRPDLWQQLRADRSLVQPAIEETLRIESPVQSFMRIATRDVEIGGTSIPARSLVHIFYGAANRDPEAFPEPDSFRLDRRLHEHLAFGYGIHYCLGAPLARVEAELALNALLDRYASVEPGTQPGTRLSGGGIIFGFERLPLRLRAS